VLAELHLAEEALALHLLLQYPEGLLDIVVANKNLHAAILSFERSKRSHRLQVPSASMTIIAEL
jgi:hypothetical protein